MKNLSWRVNPWPEHKTIYSALWDRTIKRWDAERRTKVSTNSCGSSFSCLTVGGPGSLAAAGAFDGNIKIFDPKIPGSSRPVYKLNSRSSRVTACQWRSKDSYNFLSASTDGTAMLWDA